MRRALPVVAVVLAAACTTIVEELPNAPSAPAPSSIPVIVIPVPVPTPVSAPPPTAPAPTPAPGGTPAPGATPTPAPPPPPGGSCSLPPGNGPGQNCPRTGASFLGQVDAAITQLAQQRPDIFDLSNQRGNGGYFVVKHSEFMNGVVANVRSRGLCAIVDSDDEIAVKNTNSFNDQYDILLSSGHVFRGDGSYTATCTPAWF